MEESQEKYPKKCKLEKIKTSIFLDPGSIELRLQVAVYYTNGEYKIHETKAKTEQEAYKNMISSLIEIYENNFYYNNNV